MMWVMIGWGIAAYATTSGYDRFGGWLGLKTEATGFFRTERIRSTWWLVDPEGNAFLSKGVNHISFTGDHAPALGYAPYGQVTQAKYGDIRTWAEATIQRLRAWNFNTVGAWSSPEAFDEEMPYTVILNIAAGAGTWQRGFFPDVFSPDFARIAEQKARRLVAPAAQDPYLLGYFLDNELRWGPDWRSPRTLFDDFLALPQDAPGKKALVASLRQLYGTLDAFNAMWQTRLSSFDDLLNVTQISELGDAMTGAVEELQARQRFQFTIPKKVAWLYLGYAYGNIAEVNKAFGTQAASFEALLTPAFLKRLTDRILQEGGLRDLPRPMIEVGLQMVYGSPEKASQAFGVQADSFQKLVDLLFEQKEPSPVARELMKAQNHFLKIVAERYFRVCREAIRKYDANHLILGNRFAGYAPAEVVEAMAPYVDVITFNNYNPLPPKETLERIYSIAQKPILITEFSFKAMDSGLPNTRGAGVPVQTQQDRADGFARYVETLAKLPFIVGYHWFEHADEPAEGRFDGENSNYGLVNINDQPWEVLVKRMTQVNADVENLHAQSAVHIPPVPPGHPRVYVRPDDLPEIRAKLEHPRFEKIWNQILNSDSTFCRAFVYLLTGDEEAGRQAIQQWLRDVEQYQGDADRVGRVFGNLIHQGAIVYDWCYDLLTDQQKSVFIERLEAMAASHGPGYPANPEGHAVVGHDTEGWLLTGQLPAGMAIYDESPTMYEAAARLFFRHFVPVRNFVYRAHMHHQGDSYITTRFQHDQAAAWLFRRLGAGDVFSPEQRFVPYQLLYQLRPDGQQFRSGDTFDQRGRDSRKWLIVMMTGAYYDDPILLGAADSGVFRHDGPEAGVFELLFLEPDAETHPLSDLPLTKYFPAPMGEMVARTGWNLGVESRDAVVHMRIGETFFGNHQCKDFGIFQIYYRGPLAISTGVYDTYGNAHWKNYYHQTISKNGLLIFDPSEQPKKGTANDGGQRWPEGSDHPKHLDVLLSEDYQMGKVTARAFGPDATIPDYSLLAGDITNAYASEKVKRVTRSMVTLNTGDATYPAVLIVFDRVISTDPTFKKIWLLHSIQEPEIEGQTVTVIRDGKAYGGGEYGGKLVVESLLPEQSRIAKVGGPGREFWIESTRTNYAAELKRDAVEPGAWRVEVSPAVERASDTFLHVLSVMDKDTPSGPEVRPIRAENFLGAQVLDFAVLFSADGMPQRSAELTLDRPARVLVCDLEPGRWRIMREASIVGEFQVTEDEGCLYFRAEAGDYVLTVE